MSEVESDCKRTNLKCMGIMQGNLCHPYYCIIILHDSSCDHFLTLGEHAWLVCLSVCLCVCVSTLILAPQATRRPIQESTASELQMHETKEAIFLKRLHSRDMP